jgi:uncharacterized DUF497 family protein
MTESEEDEVDLDRLWRNHGVDRDTFRVTLGTTSIEYDSEKEMVNRRKHGYSLESARVFLEELALFFIPSKRKKATFYEQRVDGEVRHIHFSIDDESNVVRFVTTMRPGEVVRVISYRRATKKEVTFLREHDGCSGW